MSDRPLEVANLEPAEGVAKLGRSVDVRQDWLTTVLGLQRGEGIVAVSQVDGRFVAALVDGPRDLAREVGRSDAATTTFRAVRYEDLTRFSASQPRAVDDRRYLGSPVVPVGSVLERFPASDSIRHAIELASREAAELGMPVTTSLVLAAILSMGGSDGPPRWAAEVLLLSLEPGRFRASLARYRDRWKGTPWSSRLEPGSGTKTLADSFAAAAEIARSTTRDPRVHARHLVTALLTQITSGPENSARVRLKEAGTDPEAARAKLFEALAGHGEDDAAWERWLLGGPAPVQIAGAASDTPTGPDLLDVEREARAMAALVAARDVTPPLAIGLFGDWGTGKSFFMRLVRDEVRRLALDARRGGRMQRDEPVWKHIAQIEFNAWHYVEGNLWASLVEHILRNLTTIDDDLGETERVQLRILAELEVARRDASEAQHALATAKGELASAEQDVQAAATTAAEARNALETVETRLARENVSAAELAAPLARHLIELPAVRDALAPVLAAVGIPRAAETADDLGRALGEAHAALRGASAVVLPLLRAPDRGRRLFWLGASALAAPAAALVANLLSRDGLPWATSVSTALVAGGASCTVWVRQQTAWIARQVAALQSAEQSYEDGIKEVRVGRAKALDAARANVRSLEDARDAAAARRRDAERDVDAAARRLAGAKSRLADIDRALEEATPQRLLARYLDDRTKSDDYRKLLGVVARIRADFEKISRLVDEGNWCLLPETNAEAPSKGLVKFGSLDAEAKDAAGRINRIVLYIDDLDRCPPRRVVEVLEAVHLLLAFPLFVVIVAVDVRWVRHALATRYRDLLDAGDGPPDARSAATVADYLEKIFQIPYRVRPLEPSGVRRLLGALTGLQAASAAGVPARTGETTEAGLTKSGAKIAPTKPPGTPMAGQGETAAANADDKEPEVPTTANERIELLEIADHEADAMDELAPLLGRSPRAVKRFVNVFRLLKASLSRGDAIVLKKAKDPAHRAVLFFLAVETGAPRLAPRVIAAAQGADGPARTDVVPVWLDNTLTESAGDAALAADRRRLREWIESRKDGDWSHLVPPTAGRWAAVVARFGFSPQETAVVPHHAEAEPMEAPPSDETSA